MFNIHTKESLTVTFKRDGKYDQDALKKLNHFMRDWRAEAETNMDPALIDLIWSLHEKLGSHEPIHLISGYRSAATNASLRKKGGGQAKKSQHIQGRAADIHFPDVAVKTLRNSALVQEVGGVGYYVSELKAHLRAILGLDRPVRVGILGAGNLGLALADYQGFKEEGFVIVGLFDKAPSKVGGRSRDGVRISDVAEFARLACAGKIDIAAVAVPAADAQNVVNLIVECGVRAILNFSPGALRVPRGVKLKNVDLTVSLESLSFFLARGDASVPIR
jgi:uncharacterized protein YcbK (DUF882 family)